MTINKNSIAIWTCVISLAVTNIYQSMKIKNISEREEKILSLMKKSAEIMTTFGQRITSLEQANWERKKMIEDDKIKMTSETKEFIAKILEPTRQEVELLDRIKIAELELRRQLALSDRFANKMGEKIDTLEAKLYSLEKENKELREKASYRLDWMMAIAGGITMRIGMSEEDAMGLLKRAEKVALATRDAESKKS